MSKGMTTELTWHNIPRIHGILVLDEAEAVHELDLCDLTGAMGREVSLDIGLGSWGRTSASTGSVVDGHRSLVAGRVNGATYHSGASCPGTGG
jgi:hypothetical protein